MCPSPNSSNDKALFPHRPGRTAPFAPDRDSPRALRGGGRPGNRLARPPCQLYRGRQGRRVRGLRHRLSDTFRAGDSRAHQVHAHRLHAPPALLARNSASRAYSTTPRPRASTTRASCATKPAASAPRATPSSCCWTLIFNLQMITPPFYQQFLENWREGRIPES